MHQAATPLRKERQKQNTLTTLPIQEILYQVLQELILGCHALLELDHLNEDVLVILLQARNMVRHLLLGPR